MAQTTEAACLLQSGSMYPQRLGLRTRTGDVLFAGIKPGAVSLYFGDAPIFHFDFDGRWQRAFVDGMHYLKGLDGTVRSIGREREGGSMVLRRKTLSQSQADLLDASIRLVAKGMIDDLASGGLEVVMPPSTARPFAPDELRGFLESIWGWDQTAWSFHRERYLATYGPFPFLPPDCPNAVVLQATLGLRGGRAFGRGMAIESRVRSLGEFQEHAGAVRSLVGRRIAQCRGVFLAGADVLRLPVENVLGFLNVIERVFPIGARTPPLSPGIESWGDPETDLETVHAFLDDFRPGLPDLGGWRAFRSAHLGRVTLGVESGDPAIRSLFGKDWQDNDLRAVVANLKAAGMSVGMVVLVGAGGRARAEAHVQATSGLIGSLPLGDGDLIFLVDARSLGDPPSPDLDRLSDQEVAGQIATIKRRSAASRGSKGPKVVAYNPDKRE